MLHRRCGRRHVIWATSRFQRSGPGTVFHVQVKDGRFRPAGRLRSGITQQTQLNRPLACANAWFVPRIAEFRPERCRSAQRVSANFGLPSAEFCLGRRPISRRPSCPLNVSSVTPRRLHLLDRGVAVGGRCLQTWLPHEPDLSQAYPRGTGSHVADRLVGPRWAQRFARTDSALPRPAQRATRWQPELSALLPTSDYRVHGGNGLTEPIQRHGG